MSEIRAGNPLNIVVCMGESANIIFETNDGVRTVVATIGTGVLAGMLPYMGFTILDGWEDEDRAQYVFAPGPLPSIVDTLGLGDRQYKRIERKGE